MSKELRQYHEISHQAERIILAKELYDKVKQVYENDAGENRGKILYGFNLKEQELLEKDFQRFGFGWFSKNSFNPTLGISQIGPSVTHYLHLKGKGLDPLSPNDHEAISLEVYKVTQLYELTGMEEAESPDKLVIKRDGFDLELRIEKMPIDEKIRRQGVWWDLTVYKDGECHILKSKTRVPKEIDYEAHWTSVFKMIKFGKLRDATIAEIKLFQAILSKNLQKRENGKST